MKISSLVFDSANCATIQLGIYSVYVVRRIFPSMKYKVSLWEERRVFAVNNLTEAQAETVLEKIVEEYGS